MSKVKPKFGVQLVPPVDTVRELSMSERHDYGLITSTGIPNAYRVAFALGQGASRKDSTFSRSDGIHTCCGSRVSWRHKTACSMLVFDDDLEASTSLRASDGKEVAANPTNGKEGDK